ncbi:MAG: hypothetical protein NVSMB46_02050 [Candidatus Saccharimonadales bacterium]
MDAIIIFCAKYLFMFVVVGIIVAWIRSPRNSKIRLFITALVAGIIAFGIAYIAKHLFYDPRPFVTDHMKPLIAHAADNGFPSDHALFTMTLTAVTYFFSKKITSIMLVITIIVGVARVLADIHSPLDIAAGWFVAIIGTAIAYVLLGVFMKNPKVRIRR